MALGHLSGIVASIALILGGCGFALFLLRKNFKKDIKEVVPKKKSKIKKVAAKAAPQETPRDTSRDAPQDASQDALGAQTVETRTEFKFDLEPKAAVEVSVPQLLASSQNQLTPLATSEPEVIVPEVPVDPSGVVQKVEAPVSAHRSYKVTSIHVAIWPYDRVLERLNPDHAFEALNEFHGIGVSWAERNQVIYERSSGASFYLHWTDESKAADALRITLELRQEFMEWNDVRKAQGYLPFMVVMGADLGLALWAVIGPDGHRKESIVGEVTARSRALSQISLAVGTNLLASDTLWSSVSGQFLGEKVASATLTAFKNLTTCYKIQGYYDEQGKEVWMRGSDHYMDPESCHADAPRIEKNEPTKLWHVNNGSQILGPLCAKDVGRALYSLDLDFDCECWEAGGANRVSIERSGMFGGVADEHARFWVFDGDVLHGPLTEEFLKTGMGKKVFPRDSYVCEKSTINGWKPLMELRASIFAVEAAPASVVTPVFEAPVAVEAPVLGEVPVAEVTSNEPVLVNMPVFTAAEEVEEEEPTASMDLVAMAAAAAASGSAEPSLSLESFGNTLSPVSEEPPAPPAAPMLVSLESAAPSSFVLEEPPAPPMFSMPEPPAPPTLSMPEPPAAPVIELKPMTLEAAPAFELAPPAPPTPPAAPEAPPAPVATAEVAPAIEMPILMPVLEAVASPRKSA
ncbi:MAG: hypothetical protein ACJ763_10800 [Bdellovibrionia bacterium]